MSNYKGHCSFNIFLALPALVVAQYYLMRPASILLAVFIGMFLYTTLFMNPDLDLAHKIRLASVRGFFSIPFRAYSSVFKHRGVSHSFLLGSFTRIAWLSGIALLIFYLVFQALPSSATFIHFWKLYKPYLLYAIAGICLADWCHLVLDLKLR